MRNVFFALAFMLVGTFAFANTNIEPVTEKEETTSMIETKFETIYILEDDDFIRCTRSCFYQGGELLGCTEWECEYVIELDEVIIQA